ncbi:MAG: DUF1016 family protein [Chitinophagales bacterium]|nr:DUF1016 family protein [Chitinophagales bacterium]
MTPNKQYKSWLAELKQNISTVRLQTSLQVNANMLMVYWYVGKQILEKQEVHGWGSGVIKQLAVDLRKSFPDTKGFSERNLVYMRQFAAEYSNVLITQTVSAQIQSSSLFKISWSHHTLLLDKIEDLEARLWYIEQSIQNGWSVRVLDYQISTHLYQRQHKKKKTTNFHLTLPKEQSDLASQILNDPYNFEFLQIGQDVSERELETQLTNHIQQFLLELGAGFAYVGRQFKLKLGRKEYFLDLLFYHLHLRSFIVIELKMGEFEPEFAGKMNAYLNTLNKDYKNASDNPSIGIILCNSKDEVEVEYALQGLPHPIGVSQYKTMHSLPKNLRDKLPSVKQLKDAVKEFNQLQKKHLAKAKSKR